jgi:dephospho-CoA kinase
MPVIGITGGISTGKTTFCECLRELLPDAKFFNADYAARQLVDHDEAVKKEIIQEFGGDIYSGEGSLNRGELRATVFQSAPKKRALEQILHPRIRRQWSAEAKTYRNSSEFFFADIPLLYETGGETLCDRVAVVACSPDVQLERLLRRGPGGRSSRDASGKALAGARPSMDAETAQQIIESQMPLQEKIKRADHVVWNNGDRPGLSAEARLLVELWRR